jgi:mevalonate kinase
MPGTSIQAATASAPGKLILCGEHAVVYRRPALVAAVDLRLGATFRPRSGRSVHLVVPALNLDREVAWRDVLAYARRARERWRRWQAGDDADFAAVRGDDPAHLLLVALGETAERVAAADGAAGGDDDHPGLRVEVHSQLPTGCGFGSSAAAAAVLVAGYFAARGVAAGVDEIEALALEAERRQHGLPSGIDGAAVVHGGLLWAERRGDRLVFRPFDAASPLLSRFAVFHTGPPAEGTGTVVAEVRRRAAAQPQRYAALWDEIEAVSRDFRDLLASGDDDVERGCTLMRRCQAALEAAGVVPDAVRRRVRRIEAAGGAAKISGAGSLAGPGAGTLLVLHPEPERLDHLDAVADLDRHPVRLGAPGLRVETAAESGAASTSHEAVAASSPTADPTTPESRP